MTDVLFLRGTGEARSVDGAPTGRLAALTPLLTPVAFRLRDVDYPAAIGPANPENDLLGKVSMHESIQEGIRSIKLAIYQAPGPVALVGYSLGAMVISRFLEELHSQRRLDLTRRIRFVGLVANPLRAEGDSIDGRAKGWGIAGQHRPWPPSITAFEVANPRDAITSCPPNSPMRTLADVVTFAAADDLDDWGRDVMDRIKTGRWQPNGELSLRDYMTAVSDMWGYLVGGEHTDAYAQRPAGGAMSYLERLAAHMNRAAGREVLAA